MAANSGSPIHHPINSKDRPGQFNPDVTASVQRPSWRSFQSMNGGQTDLLMRSFPNVPKIACDYLRRRLRIVDLSGDPLDDDLYVDINPEIVIIRRIYQDKRILVEVNNS